MQFTRREMLKVTMVGAAGLMVPTSLKAGAEVLLAPPRPRRTLPILQGATDDTKTQFAIVHPAGTEISGQVVLPNGQALEPDRSVPVTFSGQSTTVTQLFFSRLAPGQDLQLVIIGPQRKVLDRRVFRTIDPTKSVLSFAICSCMDDKEHDPAIWKDLAARSPDLIFFIGDSVYADQELKTLKEAKPATLWRRFSESRAILEVYHLPRLIPVIAVWDDHDFGNNDTNSQEYPYAKESRKNFLTFFPQNPDYCRFMDRGPGVASVFRYRGQQILLLDDRSYRLPSGTKDRYGHWGKAQENWAIRRVKDHSGPSWLMNGSQFFPEVIWKESVSRNHPEQFKGFLAELAKTRRKVVFASGDVHYSEISRIEPEILGYETFEVTSSSIHSKNFPGFPGLVPNRRRIESTGKRNYVLVRQKGPNRFLVESRSPGSVVRFARDIDLS